jgi:MoaA/NifB/PqqE/SkfB family radical SAM enzyme
MLYKFVKKMVLTIPPIRRKYEKLNGLRSDIENLRNQNNALNLKLGNYSFLIDKLDKLHDDVVESILGGNKERKQYVCNWPFSRVQIEQNGDVITCCTTYLKQGKSIYSIGNVFSNSFEEIWNSDKAKKLRYTVSLGNFEYCTNKCPILNNPSLYPTIMMSRKDAGYHYDNWEDCFLNKTPTNLFLSIDPTCNLYCPSCRNNIRMRSDSENEKINYILNNFVRPALKDCESLTLDGCGEFLVSKQYEQFLYTITKSEFPKLKLAFFTNAQLFTPERWKKFSNLLGMNIEIDISIDAASKEVYEKLRRGGKWETLCKNMEYISSLKTAGHIKEIKLRFVVQKGNAHQLEDFVELGKKWNIDAIYFQRLGNYGNFTDEAFAEQSIFSHKNTLLRDEVVKTINKLINETKDLAVFDEGNLY